MRKICICLITLVMCFVLVGCGKKEEKAANNSIVGTWEYVEDDASLVYTFELGDTGTYAITMDGSILEQDSFTYSINGNTIILNYSDEDLEEVESKYSINDNKLVINKLEDMTFIKK